VNHKLYKYLFVVFCTALLYYLCACEEKHLTMNYTPKTAKQAVAWQKKLRSKLLFLLKIDDLASSKSLIPLHPEIIFSEKWENFIFLELEINSTGKRRIKIVLTIPTNRKGPFPAIVVIGGHGCTRHTCYTDKRGYYSFARVLAENGYVTISTQISQHNIHEKGRTLTGERLWDLMRCVDFLKSLNIVDAQRIGCAGKSLGGEMAMWLGAMDERIEATISSGFCTEMDHMEKDHCMCWKFDGLREVADFSDIYSLIAPRALLCQNGLQESYSQFPVSIAHKVMKKIKLIYDDFGKSENLVFFAHKGGHVIDLPSLLAFFEKYLRHRKIQPH
jgi:hypothetical protein